MAAADKAADITAKPMFLNNRLGPRRFERTRLDITIIRPLKLNYHGLSQIVGNHRNCDVNASVDAHRPPAVVLSRRVLSNQERQAVGCFLQIQVLELRPALELQRSWSAGDAP
jgi:hypothetical protein